jgi:hypothetical protein
MANPFIPSRGDFFYCCVTPRRISAVSAFEAKVVDRVITDNSYKSCIFQCTARDDNAVVAVMAYGDSYNKGTHLFRHDFHSYTPVGPDIIKVLEIRSIISEEAH